MTNRTMRQGHARQASFSGRASSFDVKLHPGRDSGRVVGKKSDESVERYGNMNSS